MKERIKQKNAIKRKSSSIHFLIWSAFLLFALAIILLFGISQVVIVRRTYMETVSRTLATNGKQIRQELALYEQSGGRDYSMFLISRMQKYGVNAYILDGDGSLLFPEKEELGEEFADFSAKLDFNERMAELKRRLQKESATVGDAILYTYGNDYVYGAMLPSFDGVGDADYLYVFSSVELSKAAVSDIVARTVLIGVFVLVLSFAVSGFISGALVKPLTELTDKAWALARGDFTVDFRGEAYGLEMAALADTLNHARDEISKTDRMQKELIANVSHDFKTPLTMIKAYSSMIREISGENPEKRNKHAQVIEAEADRLTSLVNDLLDLSKMRAGLENLKTERFNLSEYLLDVLEKFSYLTDSQGYVFEAEIEEGAFTLADRSKIGQVLYNLIGNAVNYTGEDKKVKILLKREQSGIRFAVTDSGNGIPPEELPTIWERYYRSSEMHKRPVKGTGLGLSIVKTVLERHDFPFGVDSTVGVGSTFYVLFPIAD